MAGTCQSDIVRQLRSESLYLITTVPLIASPFGREAAKQCVTLLKITLHRLAFVTAIVGLAVVDGI